VLHFVIDWRKYRRVREQRLHVFRRVKDMKRSLVFAGVPANVFGFDIQITTIHEDKPLRSLRSLVHVFCFVSRDVSSLCLEIESPLKIISATLRSPRRVVGIDKRKRERATRY
jgi:hypothetical protein